MAQSIPSVTIPAPPPPGHLLGISHFVLEKLQMPQGGVVPTKNLRWGLKKKGYKCPTPRQHQNRIFRFQNKLPISYLREISNNLIKRCEAPYANHCRKRYNIYLLTTYVNFKFKF